jgi:hypothetical protein
VRLILELHDSDGYTCACTTTYPVEDGSKEKLQERILDAAQAARERGHGYFEFMGISMEARWFLGENGKEVFLPDVYTVDEWFAHAHRPDERDEQGEEARQIPLIVQTDTHIWHHD